MIHEIEIQNFGCIHGATVRLTRLHAFVGPNESGKSTILAAASFLLTMARLGSGVGGVRNLAAHYIGTIPARLSAKTERGLVCVTATNAAPSTIAWEVQKEDPSFSPVPRMLFAADLRRLDRLAPTSELHVSEHPENDLYPSAIAPMISSLRTLSEKAQALVTTHSPLVLNEMRPEEVTLVRRDSETSPSVFTPITETPNFADRSKVYALGELWVSYLDEIYLDKRRDREREET